MHACTRVVRASSRSFASKFRSFIRLYSLDYAVYYHFWVVSLRSVSHLFSENDRDFRSLLFHLFFGHAQT